MNKIVINGVIICQVEDKYMPVLFEYLKLVKNEVNKE